MGIVDENVQILRLVQGMAGAVTPNFRRVTLETTSASSVRLYFLLERDIAADREEINDIAFEFEALQDSDVEIEIKILSDTRPLDELFLPGRVVYGRKE